MDKQSIKIKVENARENKSKVNYWLISTVVLAIIAIILIILFVRGPLTGNTVLSSSDVGKQSVDLVKKVFGVDLIYVSGRELNGVYSLDYTLQGKPLTLQATKDFSFLSLPDGRWLRTDEYKGITGNAVANQNSSSTQQASPPEATKSDKPKVEVMVFSYCPYGLQFEKALFPAYDLLKDKANINIVYIGAMHGEFEHIESLRQLAILSDYGKDKLFSYLKLFDTDTSIGNCNGDDKCLSPLLDKIYTQLGIDKSKIEADMNSASPALYSADEARASQLGVSGSPTLVINDVQVSAARNADGIKDAICSAFTTVPSECSQKLSSANASPGFGYDSSASSASAASCG